MLLFPNGGSQNLFHPFWDSLVAYLTCRVTQSGHTKLFSDIIYWKALSWFPCSPVGFKVPQRCVSMMLTIHLPATCVKSKQQTIELFPNLTPTQFVQLVHLDQIQFNKFVLSPKRTLSLKY